METQRKTEEVLAVDRKAITKAKITYAEKSKSEKQGRQGRRPGANRRQDVHPRDEGGEAGITGGNGKKVSPAEDKAVRADANDFGQPDPLLAAMPGTPLKVGEKVEALSTALQKLIQSRDDSKEKADVKDVVVTLAAIEEWARIQSVYSRSPSRCPPGNEEPPSPSRRPSPARWRIRARDG